MSKIVLELENISKYYKLGQYNNGTFFRDLQSRIAKYRGKEDPNSIIGMNNSCDKEGFWALKDINLKINEGDRIGIIGKNGAGKSTLLKLISEITAPTSGVIKIKGRVASLLEVGTGFHPEMTGRENIYLNGAILGMRRSEINAKINDIIEFSEIEKHIDTPVKRYSSGMYVRLAFAVAAHLDSEILIADEVLAVGDAAFQKKALGKMNEISTGQGRTVLFVSHNMSAVKALCNKGAYLDSGRLTYEGNLGGAISAYYDISSDKSLTVMNQLKSMPEDESFRFEKISIKQDGNEVGEVVGNAYPIEIEMEYVVKKAESGLRVYFDICDSSGEMIIRSFNDEQGDGMSHVYPGRYVSRTIIPANLLGPTTYILVFQGTIFNVRNCVGEGIKRSITVVQDGIYNRAYPNDTFRGKLGLALEWNTEKID